MIGMIVVSIDNFSSFAVNLQRLGGRHNIYGVKPKDYVIFARILSETIATLIEGSEGLDSNDVGVIWLKVCSVIFMNRWCLTFQNR